MQSTILDRRANRMKRFKSKQVTVTVSVLCVGICMGLFSTTPASGQLPQDGLLLWLDANSKWSIKDGNGFDANHASFNPNDVQTWEDQATFDGAQNAMRFDGTSWSYSTNAAFPNGGLTTNTSRFTYADLGISETTIFWVLNRPDDETHTPIAQQTIDFPGSTPGGPSFPGAIVYDQGVNQLRVGFRNRKGTFSNPDMFVQDVPVIAMWSYNGGGGNDINSFDMRRNPNAFGQAPGTYDATDWGPLESAGFVGSNNHTDFIGGENSPGNAREWAALLVYDHVLSEEDQIQVMDFLGNEYGIPSVSSSGPPTDHVWTVDASGSWSSVNNWSFGIIPNSDPNTPNSGSHSATFGSKITAPRTVFTESEITVNRIVFDNANEYVIAGNYPIYLAASTVPADPRIDVASGAHQFQTSVNLLSDTVVEVNGNATLIFNNELNLGGKTLTKTGDGTLSIRNDFATGGGTLLTVQGTINGNGTVGGSVENTGGTVAPGNSPGVLTIEGNYTQGSAATLAIEIAGTGAGTGHDQLDVNGSAGATLDGTLDITTVGTYSPGVGAAPGEIGDTFKILTANSVNGTFSTINGNHIGSGKFYLTTYNSTDVTLGAFQALAGDADGDKDVDVTDFNLSLIHI